MSINSRLLVLLQQNSRATVTELASQLGVSRITVKEHMQRLEKEAIASYTVKLKDEITAQQVRALVLIAVDQGMMKQLSSQLRGIHSVVALHSISGEYDYAATLCADNTALLDQDIDRISETEGVLRTMTSVILSTKFSR
ncbi:AsnC family transcriptional regulator [Sinobacterium caligoides]|uniref:AsnC family transcriptional regulator n=1 Tax=Sinobacterium caligoides TaxID=933926 RepID=A0A3N2DNS5_9GAMM|nr:Lrp/AsnC family transcriptional regulator [Sinobacterium caligoides]ROS01464.1 AsnC family transcriptional regulator [Sinobacterium caligoides]